MKSYLVRITPLIYRSVRRRFCVTQLCFPVSRPGLCRIPGFALGCRGPGGCSGPALALRAGVNLAFQATKKTPHLCAEVSDLIY